MRQSNPASAFFSSVSALMERIWGWGWHSGGDRLAPAVQHPAQSPAFPGFAGRGHGFRRGRPSGCIARRAYLRKTRSASSLRRGRSRRPDRVAAPVMGIVPVEGLAVERTRFPQQRDQAQAVHRGAGPWRRRPRAAWGRNRCCRPARCKCSPAGSAPGHLMINGSRIPPSYGCPLPARSGAFEVGRAAKARRCRT